MLGKLKRSVDNGKAFGTLQTDQNIDHNLLIAKVNAYGSILTALKLINDYLSNKNSGVKQIHPVEVGMKVITSVKSRPTIIQISF